MAASNFERAFSLTLKHEGGYVDHPNDPGGATNLGVTIGTLSSWLGRPASKAEVRALTRESVKPIYKRNYWDKVRGDELPPGVDYATYDYAVNSGPSRGAKALQKAVGVAQDGVVGSFTLASAGNAPLEQTINRICDGRMAFLRALSTFKTFGKGWTSRVAGVRAEALVMARTLPMPTPPVVVKPLPPTMPPMSGPIPAKPIPPLADAIAQIQVPKPVTVPSAANDPKPGTVRTGGLWSTIRDLFTRKA